MASVMTAQMAKADASVIETLRSLELKRLVQEMSKFKDLALFSFSFHAFFFLSDII